MQYKNLHKWDVSPAEAVGIQNVLREKIILESTPLHPPLIRGELKVRYIAGADISYDRSSHSGYSVVVVMRFPDLGIIEEQWANGDVQFPYIPGLLAFREGPILLKAFEKIKKEPDLIIFDGQGIAHPRGIGIASHMGLILDKPSIGCAKSRLFGRYKEPGENKGDFSYLYDSENKIIGAVVRTRTNTNPVFVSAGNKIDLPSSIEFILKGTRGYRIPEPTRIAHTMVNGLMKREKIKGRW
jgi:deoxyribonuclease V